MKNNNHLGRVYPGIALVLTALILAACSSGGNKNGANAARTNNAVPAASVAASTTGAVASTTTTTTATNATSVATPTVATTTAAARATVPATSAPTTAVSTAAASSDTSGGNVPPECQSFAAVGSGDVSAVPQLQAMALQQSDYPPDYLVTPTSSATAESSFIQTAINPKLIAPGSGLPFPGVISLALSAAKDANTLHKCFAAVRGQIQSFLGDALQNAASSRFQITVTEISVPKIGDEAVGLKIMMQGQADSTPVTIAGYAVAWRHGRIFGTISVLGSPGPDNADQAIQLARKQDSKLKDLP
jgi:hypothetical protein